jgi:hypothetical protein
VVSAVGTALPLIRRLERRTAYSPPGDTAFLTFTRMSTTSHAVATARSDGLYFKWS